MNEFENRIKTEFDSIKLPDVDMQGLVKQRISEVENDEKLKRELTNKHNKNVIVFMKPVKRVIAAILILVIICGASTGVYAGINGMSINDVFSDIWNHITGTKVIQQVSCDACVNSEFSSFKNIKVRPYKIIGDENGIYIILQITSESGINLSDTMAFEDYNVSYKNDADATLDMYSLGCEDNNLYVAVEYIGGTSGTGIDEVGEINLVLDNLYAYDYLEDGKSPKLYDEDLESESDENRIIDKGSYTASISYSYKSTMQEVNMSGQLFKVSNLTMSCETENEDQYYKLLDSDMYLNMKDGTNVLSRVDFGIENEDRYVVVYRLDEPIIPQEIKGINIK